MPRNHWFSRMLFQGRRIGMARRIRRRIRQVELLEDRTLLATFNVTTHLDVVNAGDGVTSLREAVNSANANTGPDTITFASKLNGVQIQLGSQIGIANEITIQGNGANATVINPGGNSRAFVVFSAGVFNLSGVMIINGKSDTGGAIRNAGTTVISSSTMTINNAIDSGGAIFNVGKLTLIDSAVAFNSATNDGGGIAQNNGPARLRILNSTVSGNVADYGGGVANILGRASIVSSTIVGNTANVRSGGLFAFSDAQTVTAVNNSIIAGNLHSFGPVPEDVFLTTDGVNLTGQLDVANSWANLIGNAASAGGLVNGKQLNIVGVNGAGTRPLAEIVDPTIRNNGSPVFNHALVLGSVAIDAGLNNRGKDPGLDGTFFNGDDGAAFPTDQRGPGFNRIVNAGKNNVDIGAYEFVPRTDFIVDSFFDVFDGNFSPGEFTLREAIQLANDTAGKQVITFAPLLDGQTILMGGAHFSVRDSLEIVGPANGGLTLDAQNASRIFEHSQPLTLRNLNLTGGNGTLGSSPDQLAAR